MKKNLGRMGLPIGIIVLILLLLIPTPADLSTAGHRMLAILVFSVIIWMTEAVSYPVSSGIIMSLMAFLLGRLFEHGAGPCRCGTADCRGYDENGPR